MPLQRRVPKFGFKNINRKEYQGINLDTNRERKIESVFLRQDFPLDQGRCGGPGR